MDKVMGTKTTAVKAPNYDEAKVPAYVLPDPLTLADGRRVSDAATWRGQRRGEILKLFREHVYGHSPARPPMRATVLEEPTTAVGGAGMRQRVRLALTGGAAPVCMEMLLYLPPGKGPHPVFLNLNFEGNHSICSDEAVPLSRGWFPAGVAGVVNNRATEASRGSQARRYPLERVLSRGYGLGTICYHDIEPDRPDGWRDGVRGRLATELGHGVERWGAIAAWAWGLSCGLDYLQSASGVDGSKVVVIGHSRLGKAALWAGAEDERFAMVISNDSGEGGAAIARRQFGETVAAITRAFPHWFVGKFSEYAEDEARLPVDQHELIALQAPRPTYIASAAEDLWADPRGEFLAGLAAAPVYRLLGRSGYGTEQFPAVDTPVGETLGYHRRSGRHDLLAYDWEQYLSFADRHLRG